MVFVPDSARCSLALLARAASELAPVPTTSDEPALMVYTSGTSGPPKGALYAHRVLLGHLPGYCCSGRSQQARD
jgi:acetyl-CoA synthetase